MRKMTEHESDQKLEEKLKSIGFTFSCNYSSNFRVYENRNNWKDMVFYRTDTKTLYKYNRRNGKESEDKNILTPTSFEDINTLEK